MQSKNMCFQISGNNVLWTLESRVFALFKRVYIGLEWTSNLENCYIKLKLFLE